MEEASKPLDEDEEIFTDEVQVESKVYVPPLVSRATPLSTNQQLLIMVPFLDCALHCGGPLFSLSPPSYSYHCTPQPYSWFDKYRPRKPRYFNRIHTGYDWNKYNSTHYDHDNPPPKTVQGYKFNVSALPSGSLTPSRWSVWCC